MRPGCSCSREALCDACLDADLSNLRGVAMRRGELWAERVIAAGRPRSRAWWPNEGRAAAVARELVQDLARDQRLVERLADEASAMAARRWGSGS